MKNTTELIVIDIVGALWVVAVALVFLGSLFSAEASGVWVLEKLYALLLMAGVIRLALQATSSHRAGRGAMKRD